MAFSSDDLLNVDIFNFRRSGASESGSTVTPRLSQTLGRIRFKTTVSIDPRVINTLKLGYHEGGEHREFHIVLDCVDLEALGSVINRAQAKDATLRNIRA